VEVCPKKAVQGAGEASSGGGGGFEKDILEVIGSGNGKRLELVTWEWVGCQGTGGDVLFWFHRGGHCLKREWREGRGVDTPLKGDSLCFSISRKTPALRSQERRDNNAERTKSRRKVPGLWVFEDNCIPGEIQVAAAREQGEKKGEPRIEKRL